MVSHENPKRPPTSAANAAANRRANWFAPPKASSPKTTTLVANNITKNKIGTNAIKKEGSLVDSLCNIFGAA